MIGLKDKAHERFAKAKALLLAGATIFIATSAEAARRSFDVDVSKAGGVMKPMLNGGTGNPGPAPGPTANLIDVTSFWKTAKLRFVRSGGESWVPLDTVDNPNGLFPSWSADPDDPSSYNFEANDAMVRQSLAAGVKLSLSIHFKIPGAMSPPADIGKYERVVEHIVRHYEQGWAGGMQDAVAYWDFGDEPDLGDVHWRGTPDQYYAMYAAVARAVKRVDPKLRVGGLSIAFALNQDSPYREGFLDYVRTNRLPLDFFAWKYMADFSRDPMDYTVVARELRKLLDAKGFQSTNLMLSAWAGLVLPRGLTQPALTPTELAAFHAASLIYLEDAPVTLAAMDKLGADNIPQRRDQAAPWVPDNRFLGAELMGRALGNDQRLAAHGGDDKGFAVLASKGSGSETVDILIANYAVPSAYLTPRPSNVGTFTIPAGVVQRYAIRGGTMKMTLPPQRPDAVSTGDDAYELIVRGLQPQVYAVTRRRIDAGGKDESVTEHLKGPVLHLGAAFAAPAVELVEITPES